ncbi:MAG: hypothetical protein M1826_003672, partial [Phylliscum demangeonii]
PVERGDGAGGIRGRAHADAPAAAQPVAVASVAGAHGIVAWPCAWACARRPAPAPLGLGQLDVERALVGAVSERELVQSAGDGAAAAAQVALPEAPGPGRQRPGRALGRQPGPARPHTVLAGSVGEPVRADPGRSGDVDGAARAEPVPLHARVAAQPGAQPAAGHLGAQPARESAAVAGRHRAPAVARAAGRARQQAHGPDRARAPDRHPRHPRGLGGRQPLHQDPRRLPGHDLQPLPARARIPRRSHPGRRRAQLRREATAGGTGGGRRGGERGGRPPSAAARAAEGRPPAPTLGAAPHATGTHSPRLATLGLDRERGRHAGGQRAGGQRAGGGLVSGALALASSSTWPATTHRRALPRRPARGRVRLPLGVADRRAGFLPGQSHALGIRRGGGGAIGRRRRRASASHRHRRGCRRLRGAHRPAERGPWRRARGGGRGGLEPQQRDLQAKDRGPEDGSRQRLAQRAQRGRMGRSSIADAAGPGRPGLWSRHHPPTRRHHGPDQPTLDHERRSYPWL